MYIQPKDLNHKVGFNGEGWVDMFGTPIEIGDTVMFARRQWQSSIFLIPAVVVRFTKLKVYMNSLVDNDRWTTCQHQYAHTFEDDTIHIIDINRIIVVKKASGEVLLSSYKKMKFNYNG